MALTNQQLQERMRRTGLGARNRTQNPSYVGNIGFGGFDDAEQDGPSTAGLYASSSASTAETNPANIAADIMSKDSRLMQAAETRGRQSANKRGLINSSMAVGASQDAVLDQVVPLASQEAQQRFQDNSDQRNFGFDSILSRQDYEQTGGLAGQNYGYERDLEQLRIEAAREQSALDREFELNFQDREIGARFDLANMDSDIRRELMQMESDMRERILTAEQALESKNISTEAFLTARDQYNQRVTNIMNNPDMSAEEKRDAIASEQDNLSVDVRLIEDMYSIDLPWTEDYQPQTDPTQAADDTRRRIEQFYSDILGRDADRAGLNFYEAEVTSGRMTLAQVRSRLVQSREGGTTPTSGGTPSTGGNGQQQGYSSDLQSAYQNILGRAPDQRGAAYWQDQLQRGNVTMADVRRILQASDEGQGKVRYDAQTDQLVPISGASQANQGPQPLTTALEKQNAQLELRRAYLSELGRLPDSSGYNFWFKQLESGNATIADVKAALKASPEGQGTMRYNSETKQLEPV